MSKKIANIEKFMEEFFFTTRNNDLIKLNEPQKEFKYFNYNIIKIINSIPIDANHTPFQTIFEYINEKIKNEYKEEQEKINKRKSKKKILIKNNFPEENNENSKNTITIKKRKQSKEKEKIKEDSLDNIFLVNKKFLYNDLFPNQIEKFITIQNNFSTIKSNNKNIINILRESDISNKNNNFNIKNKKNINIKEEDELSKSNIKTITLISESNLISKNDENVNEDLSKEFSLISTIKKTNENNNLFKLKYAKKENTNLKNLNLQDILNTSSTLNDKNIKDKRKQTEESVSDLINKEYNSNNNINIVIKKKSNKPKRGKQRSKLVLLDGDV